MGRTQRIHCCQTTAMGFHQPEIEGQGRTMVMFSELMHFRVGGREGENAALSDLLIDQLDMDHPQITHLVLRDAGAREVWVLSWNAVAGIDLARQRIRLSPKGRRQKLEKFEKAVRVRRDVLDALILDLQSRRAIRANDLWLEEEGGQLRLAAADTSGRAILRRLFRGTFQKKDRDSLSDWKYMEFLRGNPQAVERGARYHRRIVHLPPGEIAHLTASIPYLHAAELLALLPTALAADALQVMAPERQLQVFEELEDSFARKVLGHMAPDLAADLLGQMDVQVARGYLNRLPEKTSARIVDLLRYPADTVGGIMTNDIVTVSARLTVNKARVSLRDRLKEPDFVYFIYVVDDRAPHRLRGVVSLRQLLTARDDQTVEEIMNPYLLTLSPFDSPTEAGYRLLNSQLAALPVLGKDGELLGTVTIDAAVSQVAPRSWRAQAPRVFS